MALSSSKKNLGIQLLRMICCLLVIVTHFYGFYHLRIIQNKHEYYLGSFFYISYYYAYETFTSKNITKIMERFKRIIIPYVFWPIVFYINDKFSHYIFNKKESYYMKNLCYQIITGSEIYGIFWFLFNLLFLSLFFVIIIKLFQKHYVIVLFLINNLVYSIYYSNYANIP